MSEARYIVGDVLAALAALPDDSIDFVMTSPPFLALRSYLPDDHPDKALEIGSEPDPATFLDTLLALTGEWGRVLAPHGSICVELGDTYSGSGGSGGDYADKGMRQGSNGFTGSAHRSRHEQPRQWSGGSGWPLAKSLALIPQLYAASLSYGRNLLTGEESPAGQWRVRNVVAWCRPNPPVGALGDKFRPATSYMTIATRNPNRYFDLDAVRHAPETNRSPASGNNTKGSDARSHRPARRINSNTFGAPPLDYWVIPPASYAGSHYAVYPPALCVTPIESMTPRRVCTACGEPSRRVVETTHDKEHNRRARTATPAKGRNESRRDGGTGGFTTTTTTGWTDCGHNTWRTGRVLDPFAGSGTTLAVATGMGRDAIGIDIDSRNVHLARERVGMFLAEGTAAEAAAWLAQTPRVAS